MEENKEQVVEVDYNEELVEKYKNEYIMEEDGVGADELGEPSDLQDTFNEDDISEICGEGCEVDED